jgi:flagellin
MATVINHNIEAMNSYRNLSLTNSMMSKSLERLSSGYRINRAADDAAGLAISEKMRAQISGLGAAQKNAQDGISLIRVAEGALSEVNSSLTRMRELAVLASTDILTSQDRMAYQNEFQQLQKHVERVTNTTEFNTRTVLNGSMSTGATTGLAVDAGNANSIEARHLVIQVGANVGQQISLGVVNLRIGTWATGTGTVSAGTLNGATDWTQDQVGGLNIGYSSNGVASMMAGALGGWITVGNQYSTATAVYSRGPIDITTVSRAQTALWRIDQAIQKVAGVRAKLGAIENALTSAMNNLAINEENTQAAESRIRDADLAKEMTMFSKAQIMSQAGMSMLAQANMQPSNVLSLLR